MTYTRNWLWPVAGTLVTWASGVIHSVGEWLGSDGGESLYVESNGRITVTFEVDGKTVQDRFYPLCGMTAETAVLSDQGWAVTLPHSFHQVATVKGPKVPYDP